VIDVSKLVLADLPGVPAESIRNLPESPGVYFIICGHGVVHYIGQTVNLRTRLRKHRRLAQVENREGLMVRYWDVLKVDLLRIETECIAKFSPVLNRTHDDRPVTPPQKLDAYNQAFKDLLEGVSALDFSYLKSLAVFWGLNSEDGHIEKMASLALSLKTLGRAEGIDLALTVITGSGYAVHAERARASIAAAKSKKSRRTTP
jgi:GIY-YIG catalytic domain